MACGCASRMRSILKLAGYTLDDGVWRKEGAPEFPDDRIEDDHFIVLIEALSNELFGERATNFLRRVTL